MKIENCKLKISKHAFTLIEILVAIAIVGILAAVVLVSMSSFGRRARQSAALSSAQSALPYLVKCSLAGKYTGNTGFTFSSGGTTFGCPAENDDTQIVPTLPKGCAGWYIIETNYSDAQRAGTLDLYCPDPGSGVGERYDILCWFAGPKTGKCQACEYTSSSYPSWTCPD